MSNPIMQDLETGNLSDAKHSAKGKSLLQLVAAAKRAGDPVPEHAAHYLKGNISFQQYCDARHAAQARKKQKAA